MKEKVFEPSKVRDFGKQMEQITSSTEPKNPNMEFTEFSCPPRLIRFLGWV